MKHKPLKRHKALQPLSREHHHGLLLTWKIRMGFKNAIAPERIKKYADWFFKTHLIPHFTVEETHIFPVLNTDSDLVKKALEDHKYIKQLFTETYDVSKTLTKIETAVEQHIRFEERVLFQEIQKVATEAELAVIEKIHQPEPFVDNLEDEFWR